MLFKIGKFQQIAFILLTICYTCTGAFITNAFIFFEKDPIITCYNSEVLPFNCTRPEACKVENNYTSIFHFEENITYSWTNDFKIECKDNYIIGLFGSLFFIGNMISVFTTASYADYIGRLMIIKVSMLVRTLLILIYIFTSNKFITMIFLFLIGFINPMHSTIPYILISEYVSHEERDDYMTLMFITESFSGIFCTIFFFIYQNWRAYIILNLIYGGIFLIFSFMLHESPRFLYSHKRYDEARLVYQNIGILNGKGSKHIIFEKEEKENTEQLTQDNPSLAINEISDPKVDTKQDIKPKPEKEQTTAYSTLFTNKKLRLLILILPFIWFLDAFAFFIINFMIKYFKGGIYLNNSIIFISEVISYSISPKLMEKYGKRDTMIVCFGISGLAFFTFYFFDNIIIVYILVFFSKFGASVILNVSSLYTNESFPTDVRGRATAICSFVGKLGGVFAPMLVELPIFKYMGIISGVLCFSASLMLLPLENKKLRSNMVDNSDQIELDLIK